MKDYFKHVRDTQFNKKSFSIFDKILEDKHNFKIIQAVRQSGKTSHLTLSALSYSQFYENKTIFIGVVNHAMCKYIKDEIMNAYQKLKIYEKHGIQICNTNHILFENGSEIRIHCVTQDCVRGYGIDYVLLDEFAFVDNNVAKSFIESVYPCLYGKRDAKFEIYSTRKNRSKKNMFWKLWLSPEKHGFKCFSIPSKQCPHLKPKLKQMKTIMTKQRYEREFIIKKV